jgi:hypothetical protein
LVAAGGWTREVLVGVVRVRVGGAIVIAGGVAAMIAAVTGGGDVYHG